MEQQQLRFQDQGGRRLAETNLFLALSASLGPVFGVLFFLKNPTQNLIWTKTCVDCISSQFHSKPVCLSPLPRRGPGTSMPDSSRQPQVPNQDPAQQGLGTSSIRKDQVCPLISLFQLLLDTHWTFGAKFQIPASLRLGSAEVQGLGLDPELVQFSPLTQGGPLSWPGLIFA